VSHDQPELHEPKQYLIGGPSSRLSSVLDTLASEDGAEVLSTRPDSTSPDLLVVRMTPARAALLQQQAGDEVTVELDEPLEPLASFELLPSEPPLHGG
jgi:hypothetical protein